MAVDILSKLNTNGSGLNLRELATSLTAAEIAPLQQAQTKKAEAAQLSLSALGQVRAQFTALTSAVDLLRENPVLRATSSNAGVAVRVTGASKITDQAMTIEVDQIAQRQVLEFAGFASRDALVGGGSLQVEIGVWFDDAGKQAFAVDPESTVRTLTIPSGATLSMLAETLDALPGMQARELALQRGQAAGDAGGALDVVPEVGCRCLFLEGCYLFFQAGWVDNRTNACEGFA